MRQVLKIGIVWTVFLLASCGPKKAVTGIAKTVKDSTVTEVTYRLRDTAITIPGDTLKIEIPYYELKEEPIVFTHGTQTAKVGLSKDDLLTIECIQAETERLVQVVDRLQETVRELSSSERETITVPDPYVPWYIKILAWAGAILLISIVGILITKLFSR